MARNAHLEEYSMKHRIPLLVAGALVAGFAQAQTLGGGGGPAGDATQVEKWRRQAVL